MDLRADLRDPGTPLHHSWNECVGAGRAQEGLRATWQEHLRTAAGACGFRSVRLHGLFHDDMFVLREGRLNFQYVHDLHDRLIDAGVRPFVELGFAPRELARTTCTVFWWGGHGAMPTDLDGWSRLVTATARDAIGRYGIEEVRRWNFEVWNEPNLRPFFDGTRSEYFALYAATARALKDVDAGLRVGGPATSNFVPDGRFDGEREDPAQHARVTGSTDLDALDWRPVWIEAFLEHCAGHDLPVDFVSCHPYPTDWALDGEGRGGEYTRGAGATATDLRTLRGIVDTGPFPEAAIHLTEWSSTPSSRDHTHDSLPAATFVVRANLETIGLADSLAYWTFTDVFEEQGAGDTAFHGGFGMITYQGVPKPTFHAYRMLGALGDELLCRTTGAGPGGVVTRRGDTLTALAYHYPPEMPLAVPRSHPGRETAEATAALGAPAPLSVTLTGLAPGAPVTIETLDAEHGNPLAEWARRGHPEPLSRADADVLRACAPRVENLAADGDGVFALERPIAPWSVVLVSAR